MPDSQLNGAERALQHSFMKSVVFNGLVMAVAISLIYLLIRALPERAARPARDASLSYQAVDLKPVAGQLRLAGAWVLDIEDRRFGGLSGLAFDDGAFLAVTDRGALVRFHPPGPNRLTARVEELRLGPGPYTGKWTRDAESLARDPLGRGWWVGFEQRHSLWLYNDDFQRVLDVVNLARPDWTGNGGAEGLVVRSGQLLVLGQNGSDGISIGRDGSTNLKVHSGAEIADAARAPDGGSWVLLRQFGAGGINQSIAPLVPTHDGYRVGPALQLPKDPLDNFEGMVIEARPGGTWRFWLVSDDDFRSTSRTLLVALDRDLPARHDKSPAPGTGLSKQPSVESP